MHSSIVGCADISIDEWLDKWLRPREHRNHRCPRCHRLSNSVPYLLKSEHLLDHLSQTNLKFLSEYEIALCRAGMPLLRCLLCWGLELDRRQAGPHVQGRHAKPVRQLLHVQQCFGAEMDRGIDVMPPAELCRCVRPDRLKTAN